jgi:hypothetical protein
MFSSNVLGVFERQLPTVSNYICSQQVFVCLSYVMAINSGDDE